MTPLPVPAQARTNKLPRWTLGLAACLFTIALVVATLAYLRVGWSRMESACTADPPRGALWSSVETGWSWTPLGFECAYDDGKTVTSLWF